MNQAVKMFAIFVQRETGTGKIPRNKSMLSSCLDTGMISSLSVLSSQYYCFISGRRSITFGQRVHMGLKSCPVMQI